MEELNNSKPLKYRPEIDGMRAIAVLPVVLFHLDVTGFGGGYLGVDIFFVISGFLITSIINKEMVDESFSILKFYERRSRRILPALFFMMAVTTVCCWLVFDPNAFANFGASLVATTLFASNFYFWTDIGYFAAPALEKPLLHTWSLSIEEQFYIFFPFLLLLVHRLSNKRKALLLFTLWLLSFLICIYGDIHHPDATFYLVPTRVWELLSGSILAISVVPQIRSSLFSEIIALVGSFLILVGIFFVGQIKPSHVFYGILPVIGCLMIIYANSHNQTLVGKALSHPALVKIGLISYSLYLWHWPVDVFAKYISIKPLSGIDKLFLILLSFLLAFISWKFIEQPFRQKGNLFTRRKLLFGASALAMMMSTATGAFINLQQGFAWRNPNGNEILAQAEWDWHIHGSQPLYGNLEILPGFTEAAMCGEPSKEPEFVMWGDSHAMAWIPGLDKSAKLHEKSVAIFTHSSYPPILSYEQFRSSFNTNILSREVLTFISNNESIKTVILAAAWYDYFHLYKIPGDNSGIATFNMVKEGLFQVSQEIKSLGLNLVVLTDVPWLKNSEYTVRSFYLHSLFPSIYDLDIAVPFPSFQEYSTKNAMILKVFHELEEAHGVIIHNVEHNFYNEESDFLLHVDHIPIYRDSGHLSTFGSEYLYRIFEPIICNQGRSGHPNN